MRTFSVTREEERKARARVLSLNLCLCRFLFISYLLVAFSPSAREERDTPTKKGKRGIIFFAKKKTSKNKV